MPDLFVTTYNFEHTKDGSVAPGGMMVVATTDGCAGWSLCNPEDVFVFDVGYHAAIDRLESRPVRIPRLKKSTRPEEAHKFLFWQVAIDAFIENAPADVKSKVCLSRQYRDAYHPTLNPGSPFPQNVYYLPELEVTWFSRTREWFRKLIGAV